MNPVLSCPVCSNALNRQSKSFICVKNHTYDTAKSGYVNLLLPHQMKSKIPGDNKLMVNSRRNFLDRGYYSPLKDKLCGIILKHARNGGCILDAGCGDGYYTAGIKQSLDENNINAGVIGIDISKHAADAASKRCKDITFAAASVFRIPVPAFSCGIVISVFAPCCGEEFKRVLEPDGIMVMAIPSAEHLIELKSAVYDKPYLNEVGDYKLDGFNFIECEKLKYGINIENNTDIQNLFTMTPYYYKTSEKDQKKLSGINTLDTTASFEILIYRKA